MFTHLAERDGGGGRPVEMVAPSVVVMKVHAVKERVLEPVMEVGKERGGE